MKTLKDEFKDIGYILTATAEKFTVTAEAADGKMVVVYETSSLPNLKRFYNSIFEK